MHVEGFEPPRNGEAMERAARIRALSYTARSGTSRQPPALRR